MKRPFETAVLAAVLLIALAAPASAQRPPRCPAAFAPSHDMANTSGKDDNGNTVVCFRPVQAPGLELGGVFMDDRGDG